MTTYTKERHPLHAAYRPYTKERRTGACRRKANVPWDGPERRQCCERRLDADWRFAMIRRRMNGQEAPA